MLFLSLPAQDEQPLAEGVKEEFLRPQYLTNSQIFTMLYKATVLYSLYYCLLQIFYEAGLSVYVLRC
jgi:hypothetical protein